MISKLSVASAALALLITHSAQAATAFITFDDLATGPDNFPAAIPSPQTIIYPQATFSGGAVLGNATYFPAQGFATVPNIYGTAWFGNNLAETLTITINPTFPTSEVNFPLFNGVRFSQSYTVSAFDSLNSLLVSHQYFIPANGTDGFAMVDLLALGIAKVTITPDGAPSDWDFVIDSVTLSQSLQPVPLPAALPLFASGVGALAFLARRRKKKIAAAGTTIEWTGNSHKVAS
jgi:hypothetical protein